MPECWKCGGDEVYCWTCGERESECPCDEPNPGECEECITARAKAEKGAEG